MTEKVFIIAEAGVNHNGSIQLAKQLIEEAAQAGADCVKFQTFIADKLASNSAKMAEYQVKNTKTESSQLEMLKQLELSHEKHTILIEHCKKNNIEFLSSAFDLDSLWFLKTLDINRWKIPSGEITNYPYLKIIGSFKQNVLLSTGMSTLGEVEDAIIVLETNGTLRKNITLLHCNTEYPTPFSDVNLLAMKTLKHAFATKVGYSDHTNGIEIPIAAVALGATCIEKHFTIDKSMPGPDHKASLEPQELKAMVTSIRNIELALGNGIKLPSPSELKNKEIARKSIIAISPIHKGEIFSENNLGVLRPGNGISPMLWNNVIGKTATKSYNSNDLIEW